jgi:hypothetical protein
MIRRVATAEAMANTNPALHYHVVFGTKNREPLLIESSGSCLGNLSRRYATSLLFLEENLR